MATNIDRTRGLPEEEVLDILRRGAAEVRGLFPLGTNDTFLCELRSGGRALRAVYKPVRGERPLWDFPAGTLAKREAAAYEVSRLLGWNFVPPTVFRGEGPLGPGSFQQYLDLDLEQNYFLLRDTRPDALRRVAAFDILINNADRKAMHVLCDTSGAVWLIDHGVCFHHEWKLRTVIWDFAGEAVPEDILTVLKKITKTKPRRHNPSESDPRADLQKALSPLLASAEIEAFVGRSKILCRSGKYPVPGPGLSVPWPVWA